MLASLEVKKELNIKIMALSLNDIKALGKKHFPLNGKWNAQKFNDVLNKFSEAVTDAINTAVSGGDGRIEQFSIPAGAWDLVSVGSIVPTLETKTFGDVDLEVLTFANDQNYECTFCWKAPSNLDPTYPIKVKVTSFATAGTLGDINWRIAMMASGDGAIPTTLLPFYTDDVTLTALNAFKDSTEFDLRTIAAGDNVKFHLSRNAVGDSFDDAAHFYNLQVKYREVAS